MNSLMLTETVPLATWTDVNSLLTKEPVMTARLLSQAQPQPIVLNPLLDEYLRAYILDLLRGNITHIALREHVGRVVLVDVKPVRQVDPPIPLVLFSELPISGYLGSVRELLHDRLAGPLRCAIDDVMWASVGVLSPGEVAYFYVKALSLATGAYRMIENEASSRRRVQALQGE